MPQFLDIRRHDHAYRDGRFYHVLDVPSPLTLDSVIKLRRTSFGPNVEGETVEWPLIELERAAYAGRAALIPGPGRRDGAGSSASNASGPNGAADLANAA